MGEFSKDYTGILRGDFIYQELRDLERVGRKVGKNISFDVEIDLSVIRIRPTLKRVLY